MSATDPTYYPLTWPTGKPRTTRRQIARFMTRLADAYDGILAELERFGARQVVVSCNVRFGPRGGARVEPGIDPGVAVYFTLRGANQCIAIDQWTTVEDNMQAVHKSVAAIRGLTRWGFDQAMVDAAFAGFAALGSGTLAGSASSVTVMPGSAERPWWEVLGVPADAQFADVSAAYRKLAKVHHPDVGGTHAAFDVIQRAYDDAQRGSR